MTDTYLCCLSELPEFGCKEFALGESRVFAVHRRGQVYVYVNQCPHAGTPLNWLPDRFFDREGKFLQCASHGALFEIDTGLCVAGPCSGRSLRAIPHKIESGKLYISE